jgi:hypothetical protein
MKELHTTDPGAHVDNVRQELDELVDHLRRDVAKVTDPKARALFSAAADVLEGLLHAFDHYASDREDAAAPGPV